MRYISLISDNIVPALEVGFLVGCGNGFSYSLAKGEDWRGWEGGERVSWPICWTALLSALGWLPEKGEGFHVQIYFHVHFLTSLW